jgi:hypothetical protein
MSRNFFNKYPKNTCGDNVQSTGTYLYDVEMYLEAVFFFLNCTILLYQQDFAKDSLERPRVRNTPTHFYVYHRAVRCLHHEW